MTKSKHLLVLIAVAGTAFLLGRTLPSGSAAMAQEKKQPDHPKAEHPKADQPKGDHPQMDPKMMEAFQLASTPGPQHKHLELMAGTWEGHVKFRMGPDDPFMSSAGTATREWILGNRFLKESVNAAMPEGGTFNGLGIMGYNTVEKRYESIWLEDHATYMSWATGTFDPVKKTFTMTGDMLDPMTGKRMKNRTVVDCSDPNVEIMLGYCTREGGKEYQCFEGRFTKKK